MTKKRIVLENVFVVLKMFVSCEVTNLLMQLQTKKVIDRNRLKWIRRNKDL